MKRIGPAALAKTLKSHHDFMWAYFRDVVEALFRPAMAFLVLMGVATTLVFAAIFYWAEGPGINPDVHDFFDAFYFTVSTMTTVGFGDIAPATRLGRAIAIIMMFIGTGLFVSYTAVIAGTIMSIEERRRRDGEREF